MKKSFILLFFLALCQISLQAQAMISVKIVSPNSFAFHLSGKITGVAPSSAFNIIFADVPVNPSIYSSNFSFSGSSMIGSQFVSEIHVGYNNAPYAGSIQFRVPTAANAGDTLLGCDTVVLSANHGLTSNMFDGTYPIYWGRGASSTAGTFQSYVDSSSPGFTFPMGNAQSFCSSTSPTLQDILISGPTGATYSWYDAPSGGSLLPSNQSLQNATTYYASLDGNNCLTSRLGVSISIINLAAPTLPQGDTVNFCAGDVVTFQDIQVAGDTGAVFTWYDAMTLGNVLSPGDTLQDGNFYFVSQTSQGCESNRTVLVVNSINLPSPTLTGGNAFLFCEGEVFTLQDVGVSGASGATFTWYDAQTGGNILPLSTVIQNGQSYWVTQSAEGCESGPANMTALEMIIDTSVTQNFITLTANASTGVTYQWIDCANFSPISGATSQVFTPAQDGNYAVILDNGTCTDTSNCHTVEGILAQDPSLTGSVLLYPNPAQDHLNLETSQELEVKITSTQGMLLKKIQALPGLNVLPLDGLSAGIYLVEVSNGKAKTVWKMVKE
ncbi:MAG: T9SS type A sorting domain-containing protein [Bacteroidia bacterium]|nr:T9SS type A sorting domain-containing protein [Bacteroidia bacterium]